MRVGMLVRSPSRSASTSASTTKGTVIKTLAGFALIALVAGPAGAQTGAAPQLPPPAGPPVPTPPPQLPPPSTPGQADAQVGFGRRVQLSPQEEVVEADRSLSRMEGAAMGIRKQLEQARQQRDV